MATLHRETRQPAEDDLCPPSSRSPLFFSLRRFIVARPDDCRFNPSAPGNWRNQATITGSSAATNAKRNRSALFLDFAVFAFGRFSPVWCVGVDRKLLDDAVLFAQPSPQVDLLTPGRTERPIRHFVLGVVPNLLAANRAHQCGHWSRLHSRPGKGDMAALIRRPGRRPRHVSDLSLDFASDAGLADSLLAAGLLSDADCESDDLSFLPALASDSALAAFW